MFEIRQGEKRLEFDPGQGPADAEVIFIGAVRSPWKTRQDCPKNMVQARERGREAAIEIAPAFRPGLAGLERVSHIVVLTWLHGAPRDLIVQQPRHAPEPHGTFALRSPARPNPVGLHMVRIVSLDVEGGIIGIDAIDVLDGTPVIDIKPYYASTDSIPDAVTAG